MTRADQLVQQAMALQRQGRLQEAAQLYQQALLADPKHVEALHLMGVVFLQSGQPQAAAPLLEKAVSLRPDFADAHANLGAALRRLGRSTDALTSFDRAIRLNGQLVEAHVGYANALFEAGRNEDALKRFDAALALAPAHAFAHCNRGAVLQVLKRPVEALDAFDLAIRNAPQMAEAHANRGNALRELGRFDEAIAACDRATELRPGYAAALAYRGFALLESDRILEALSSFDAALRANRNDARAWSGRGRALAAMGQPQQALDSYDAALALLPSDARTQFYRAVVLHVLRRYEEAWAAVDRALALDATLKGAHHLRANILESQGKREEALENCRKEFELYPDADYTLGYYIAAKLTQCDWSDYELLIATLCERTAAGKRAALPFGLLLVCDSGALQRTCAETYAATATSLLLGSGPLRGSQSEKIRIGYFSSDFGNHPVTHLMAGLFAAHDRERFEVIAYALGENRDEYTDLVRSGVDRFVDCRGTPSHDTAAKARADGLDVAVDLNGHTMGSETGIFLSRVAPVQLSYIGYLGTLGAPFMDYLIVDPVVAPPSNRAFFSEKLITLPWYQCNDTSEKPMANAPGRAHYGLSEQAFVFGSFNNMFKLTPGMFAGWLRILRRTPGSVLWMYVAEPAARQRLRDTATSQGVDAERIVFANRVSRGEHLARQRHVDLMLDTYPYNGGATTSIAIRAGVPVLTRAGEAFASRMGASLLVAANASDLIANTAEEYEEKAVQFALLDGKSSEAARSITQAHTTKLYDPEAFARHFERGLEIAVERARAGLPPEDILVN
ncbi:MAG: hypothetical protein DCF16_12895 [Alphaproteobacteria bacterium]|nr:MAG: hypothetical protein DCF16_12895 [Alphaproteobacteria bacterium]